MSCMGYLSPEQRAALMASSAAGPPLSRFASPPVTPGKLRRLRALAGSPSASIRESAALARHAPADLLRVLARDPVASARCCVARNGATPAPVLCELAADLDPHVRGWVAANGGAPADLRDALADDPDPGVRAVVAWAAAWTPRTP